MLLSDKNHDFHNKWSYWSMFGIWKKCRAHGVHLIPAREPVQWNERLKRKVQIIPCPSQMSAMPDPLETAAHH